mmetsp:Transcript_10581/g.22297  ORF Transcript_10581/g.22297 Transcript_10581/m.22297 type:complete len:614 (-) Transcript_10581:209-2050(-)
MSLQSDKGDGGSNPTQLPSDGCEVSKETREGETNEELTPIQASSSSSTTTASAALDHTNARIGPGGDDSSGGSIEDERLVPNNTNANANDGGQPFVPELLEQGLFFLAGLGSSIGYIATLSSLVYFKFLFGANSFVYLNCAVFFPMLPISLAQAIWDTGFDLIYETRVTFFFRGVLGYAFLMGGTVSMLVFALGHRHLGETANPNDNGTDGNSGDLWWVFLHALQQGIGGAILFGQLNQLASFAGNQRHKNNTIDDVNRGRMGGFDGSSANHQHPSDENENDEALSNKFKATVSAGVQASALVVLAVSLSSGFGTMNGDRFPAFWISILEVEAVCFAAILCLLLAMPRIQASMLRRDTSIRESMTYSDQLEDFHELLSPVSSWEQPGRARGITTESLEVDAGDPDGYFFMRQPLLPASQARPSSPEGINSGSSESEPRTTMLSLRELWYHSRLCCLGMALTLVPSFLVGSWFTRVQTDWMELPQILFYTRIGSDLVGRFATILVPTTSVRSLIRTAGLRMILVAAFFANAAAKIPLGSRTTRDFLSIGLVALIAFCSGYLVTSCYQLGPRELPGTSETRAANAAKQSSLLTVAFSFSAVGGLVASFFLVAAGV